MKSLLCILLLLPVAALAQEPVPKLPAPGEWALQQMAERDRTILGLLAKVQELQAENEKLKTDKKDGK